MPLLRPGAFLAIVTTRRVDAALIKSFMRRHEEIHPLFASCDARRLHELYPLLRTDKAFAVRQACDPLWPPPSSGEEGGGRRPRTLAAHVIERMPRRSAVAAAR